MSTMHSTMSDTNRFLKFPSTASRLLCLVVCPWIGGNIAQRYLFSTSSVVSYKISNSFSVPFSHAPLLPVSFAVSSFSAVFAPSAVNSPASLFPPLRPSPPVLPVPSAVSSFSAVFAPSAVDSPAFLFLLYLLSFYAPPLPILPYRTNNFCAYSAPALCVHVHLSSSPFIHLGCNVPVTPMAHRGRLTQHTTVHASHRLRQLMCSRLRQQHASHPHPFTVPTVLPSPSPNTLPRQPPVSLKEVNTSQCLPSFCSPLNLLPSTPVVDPAPRR